MLTLEQVNALLQPGQDWRDTYPIILKEVRDFLDNWTGKPLGTSQLAIKLCPTVLDEKGERPLAHRRLLHVLWVLSKRDETKGYVSQSKRVTRIRGRVVHPLQWHGALSAPEDVTSITPDKAKQVVEDYWKAHGGRPY